MERLICRILPVISCMIIYYQYDFEFNYSYLPHLSARQHWGTLLDARQ
jgi:hypothetical protein